MTGRDGIGVSIQNVEQGDEQGPEQIISKTASKNDWLGESNSLSGCYSTRLNI